MKLSALSATGLVALLATASTAAADLPNKNTDREGWIKASMTGTQAAFCGPTAPKQLGGGADPDFVADQVAKQWDGVAPEEADLDTALFLANALCKFPGNPNLQAKLMPLWQSFVSFYGLTGAADTADFVALATKDRTRIDTPSKAPADTRFADADGRTQALIAKSLLQTSYGMEFMSYAEMLDTAAKPSEHLKAAFVEECVDGYHGSLGRWAICQDDARGLDRKRFDAELAGPSIDPRDRLSAKLRFVKLTRAVAAADAKWKALADKDDGVAKVLTGLPGEARQAFAAVAADPILAWSFQLVDDARANNKKLLNGCEDTLRTHLTTYLTAKAPRSRDDLRDAFKDEVGSQLANAAALCFVRNPAAQLFWNRWSTGYTERWGVRTAIWHALAGAKVEFDTDLGRDPIGLPKPVVLFANGHAGTSGGTIAKLTPDGDNLVITFKKETWKEPVCKQWKETNRVDSIDWKSGQLVYRSVCVKRGFEKRSSQATPVTVTKTYAAGLKVGTIATFARNDDGTGYPIEIFADKKREKLVGAFGVTY